MEASSKNADGEAHLGKIGKSITETAFCNFKESYIFYISHCGMSFPSLADLMNCLYRSAHELITLFYYYPTTHISFAYTKHSPGF